MEQKTIEQLGADAAQVVGAVKSDEEIEQKIDDIAPAVQDAANVLGANITDSQTAAAADLAKKVSVMIVQKKQKSLVMWIGIIFAAIPLVKGIMTGNMVDLIVGGMVAAVGILASINNPNSKNTI